LEAQKGVASDFVSLKNSIIIAFSSSFTPAPWLTILLIVFSHHALSLSPIFLQILLALWHLVQVLLMAASSVAWEKS
jgi:hypothetical protein